MADISIDINSDLGESPEALANGLDFELMRSITSANVACGGHAGDESTMPQTLTAARELNVAVGAHPGYPDRVNFGRVEMPLSPADIETTVREQILSLGEVAWNLGMGIVHVKPHGALYHAARDRQVAEAIGRAAISVDPKLVMVGQAGSVTLTYWREMGLRCVGEAFADRAYEKNGKLRSRTLPGALLELPARAAQQALDIVLHQRAITHDGGELAIDAETLCIHSDTPNAAAIAREVRSQLASARVIVRSLVR
jgi:5-oxoprolinase (ATP-hydrolysing) subunit A